MATDYVCTTNVSIIRYNETICLPALLAYRTQVSEEETENQRQELVIEKSKMNRSTEHNYCIGIKFPLKNGVIATLKVYAAKIEIKGLRPLELVKSIVASRLNRLGATYNIKADKYLDITLFTLGTATGIEELRYRITKALDRETLFTARGKKQLIFKGAFVHATGIKNPKYFRLVCDKFIEMFGVKSIAPRLTLNRICSVMSNSKYSLGYPLNIWEITRLIGTTPGPFGIPQRSFCIYNNIQYAHMVIIVLKLEVSDEERENIWRENIETTFTVKNTGAITQSSPSHLLGLRCFEFFIQAIKFLGDSIKR